MVSAEVFYPQSDKERGEAERKRVGVLTIITGPSGAGKSEVANRLLEGNPAIQQVISTTTRPIREGEVDGIDYHFIPRDIFEDRMAKGEFLESNEYRKELYGTLKSDLSPVLEGQDMVWVVNMGRAADIEDHFRQKYDLVTAKLLSERTLPILIGVPTLLEARRRVLERDGDEEAFFHSIKADWEVWTKPGNQEKFTVVINETDQLEETMHQVVDLIEGRRLELKQKLAAA